MVTIQITVSERAKATLDRQAQERKIASSMWAGQLFDMGFAAVCGREKSMPVSDGDLDAIVGAVLLLRAKEKWDTATLAKSLGVSEPTVVKMLEAWKIYRAGADAAPRQAVSTNDTQVESLNEALAMEDLLKLDMRKRYRIVLEVLVRAPGAFVPMERIVGKLFEDHPDGGPDDADGIVHNNVSLMRRDVLKPHGWTIKASRGEGYRLERLQA
ncbi:winged helix-turn-helix domain-containing protein [Rhizobium leguminosarum]|nr:winged helix-turn-helix domain-containing protein [Rhizobium leguminosarum]